MMPDFTLEQGSAFNSDNTSGKGENKYLLSVVQHVEQRWVHFYFVCICVNVSGESSRFYA